MGEREPCALGQREALMPPERDTSHRPRVINLICSIEKHAEENSDDPYLIAMAERAKAVGELFENRQSATNTACCSAGNCARDCRRTWTRRA